MVATESIQQSYVGIYIYMFISNTHANSKQADVGLTLKFRDNRVNVRVMVEPLIYSN